MARPSPAKGLDSVVVIIRKYPDGIGRARLSEALPDVPQRTLQAWLKALVKDGRLTQIGRSTSSRYLVKEEAKAPNVEALQTDNQAQEEKDEIVIPLSEASQTIVAYISQPMAARTAVGYNRDFLDRYRPNEISYLSLAERQHLAQIGSTRSTVEPAGTYAKNILNRLLIDLSWNSSRLEGNTYTLLDTLRLIEFGQEAKDGNRLEAQMILNHKEAIAFLVSAANEIGFNRYTILNLHAMLAQNLLGDQGAAGRLRSIAVGIGRSVFHPLEMPQLVEECFNQILIKAQAIGDPFEQSLFMMVQLPYLQPFDDVNKRVSRLSANIPFIKSNLSPLSFTDVSRSLYTEAMLGVYELNRIELLKEVFIWAYEKSAERYKAVRQSLGEPDPFRQRHYEALRHLVADIVRRRMDRKTAAAYLNEWTKDNIAADEQDRFRELAESELLGLHEGNFARLQVRPSEFSAWQAVWDNKELVFSNPKAQYLFDRDAVSFYGEDRHQAVRCIICQEALHDHFQGDGRDPLEVFQQNRPNIEETAMRKYLSGQVETDGTVVIRTGDILN